MNLEQLKRKRKIRKWRAKQRDKATNSIAHQQQKQQKQQQQQQGASNSIEIAPSSMPEEAPIIRLSSYVMHVLQHHLQGEEEGEGEGEGGGGGGGD